MTTTTFDAQRQRLARLQSLAQREMAQRWQPLVVKFHDFLSALAGAKACKQPGSDDVVLEMVRVLSWPTLLWLYLLFPVRLGRRETERPEAWHEVVLTAILKKSDKAGFLAMRYISLLPVLQKFCIRSLQTAERRERKHHETNILGYEPGRSTAGVTATLGHVLSKAAEWSVGAFMASADAEVPLTALREPVARWESEGIGFSFATDHRKAQKRRRGTSGEATRNEGRVLLVLGVRSVCDGWNNESLESNSWKEKSLTIVAGPYTEYNPGDVVEFVSNNGRRWVWRVAEGMDALGTWLDSRARRPASGTDFAKPTPCFTRRTPCSATPNCRSRVCAVAVLHGAGEWAVPITVRQLKSMVNHAYKLWR